MNKIEIFCHVGIGITPSKPWYMQNFTMFEAIHLQPSPSVFGKILRIPWFIRCYSLNVSDLLCMFTPVIFFQCVLVPFFDRKK